MRPVLRLVMVAAVLLGVRAAGLAQSAERLSDVKKVYVESFGNDHGAIELREQLIRRVHMSGALQLAGDRSQADAVIRGAGRIWVTGHISLNPRSHNLNEPTFEGFLSVELIGKGGEPLWSYLVTPSSFLWSGIADDLARQAVGKLSVALKAREQPGAATPTSARALFKGAGATFPAPLYQQWFELFHELNSKVSISYEAVGSEEGINRLAQRTVDFAASDMPLSDEAMAASNHHYLHIPSVIGAVVVIYNVNGRRQTLNFLPETLAGIYLGKITRWNDPRITRMNRDAALPAADIVVVHRSEGSGTSFIFTDYLSKVSSEWRDSVGRGATVKWPVGVAAERNEGVAETVQRTPNSIGYVEFIYALQHELSYGTVKNSSGLFVKASVSSMAEAAASAGAGKSDLRLSITNAPARNAYPITSYTWLLIPDRIADADKRNAMIELLHWGLTSGQKKCAALGYAPLPADVARRALDSLEAIK